MPRAPLYRIRSEDGSRLSDAIENPGPVDPSSAVPLRAHSIGTLAELRKTIGSIDGNAGPRACMLGGQLSPLDSGAGTFVWDPTSTLADNAGQTVSAFTVAQVQGVAQGRWRRQSTPASAITGSIPQAQLPDVVTGLQVITSGVSYTPGAGTKSVVIELWGGGGASGGCPLTGAATTAAGGGGGGGGYLRKRISAIGAGPFTVAIGAGGTAVSGAAGNAGGATTFNDGVTTYTANGGGGGQSTAAVGVATAAQGGLRAAVSTNGNVNAFGTPGGAGLVLSTTTGIGGPGGSTSLGGAGAGLPTGSGVQTGGANTGGGAGGGSSTNAAANSGANGGSGLIVVTEYA